MWAADGTEPRNGFSFFCVEDYSLGKKPDLDYSLPMCWWSQTLELLCTWRLPPVCNNNAVKCHLSVKSAFKHSVMSCMLRYNKPVRRQIRAGAHNTLCFTLSSLPGVFLNRVNGGWTLKAAFRRQGWTGLAVRRLHHRWAVLQGAVGVCHIRVRAIHISTSATSTGGVARPHGGIVVGPSTAVASCPCAVTSCALQRGGVNTRGGGC